MANWTLLSETFRLTPWSLQEHADYVLQEYGKFLSVPSKAQAYVEGYKEAEAKFDQAYANQQEFLDRTTTAVGAAPQVLPPLQRLDWDPVKRMEAVIAASQPAVEAVPTPVVAEVTPPPADPVEPPVEPVEKAVEPVSEQPVPEVPVEVPVAPEDATPVDAPVAPAPEALPSDTADAPPGA